MSNNKFNLNFMSKRKLAMLFSLLIMAVSIGSIATKGLNLGIDFTGGYLIEAGYQNDVNLDQVRDALAGAEFPDAQVQNFGSSKDIIVRIAPRTDINKATIGDSILEILKTTSDKEVEMRRIEFVGPQVGDRAVAIGSRGERERGGSVGGGADADRSVRRRLVAAGLEVETPAVQRAHEIAVVDLAERGPIPVRFAPVNTVIDEIFVRQAVPQSDECLYLIILKSIAGNGFDIGGENLCHQFRFPG